MHKKLMIGINNGQITTTAQRVIHTAHIINAIQHDNIISNMTLSMILIVFHIFLTYLSSKNDLTFVELL